MEELSWLNTKTVNTKSSSNINDCMNENGVSDLVNSYQQKISLLNDEISKLRQDINDRDRDLSQLRIQCKILKQQRSQSHDRNSNSSNDNGNDGRSKRSVSVDSGGSLHEQLDASFDEIRLLKNKLFRSEDELNNLLVEKESLLAKLDLQSKQGYNDTINENIQLFTNKIGGHFANSIKTIMFACIYIETLTTFIKENEIDEKIVADLRHLLCSSRWNKQSNVCVV